MPGNVANASVTGVMPFALCTLFEQTREWAIPENVYVDGSSQRRQLVTTSRKSWALSRRATAAHIGTLRAFFESHKGSLIAFYFYDGQETSPPWTHDPTGTAVPGRYTVRFGQETWAQAMRVGATGQVDLSLLEVT